ncbi:MAG TPA: hypothetical protein VEJ38_10050 [Candidatus Acidoferrales bacterium]|nr:hypothetical protein [Candidatus Acidoferrales bacterium]
MNEKSSLYWREFGILWGLSVVLGTILIWQAHIPSTYFAMRLLLAGHTWSPLMFAVEELQTVLVFTIAVSVGLVAAHALGLGAPILENLLSRRPVASHLRAIVVPAVLVGALIAVIGLTALLPALHPNRQISNEVATKAVEMNSPRLMYKVEQTSSRVTFLAAVVGYVCGPISGALVGQMFWVSGIAWLLARAMRDPSRPPGRAVFFWAIAIATAIASALGILATAGANRQLQTYLSDVLPNMQAEPLWSLSARHLIGSVPSGFGLGWLYVRYGLEAAILGIVVAALIGHELVLHFLTWFY